MLSNVINIPPISLAPSAATGFPSLLKIPNAPLFAFASSPATFFPPYWKFSLKEISCKIAELVRPNDLDWNGQLDVIYQDVEGLRAAMPEYTGDWYFTGDYPTLGGNAVVNRAFLNWHCGDDSKRAY